MHIKKIINNWYLIIIILFMLAGVLLRYAGIEKQLSYWNDESHSAIYARGILENGEAINPAGKDTGVYQIAHYYVTAASFFFLGVNEFAGRLPSMLVGVVLVALIFFVTRKIVGEKEAFVASFLMAFSQMQLAWSTQLRPYIWMELFTLLVLYYCHKLLSNKRPFLDNNFVYGCVVALISIFFHGTGLMNFVLIAIAIAIKSISLKRYKYLLTLIPISLVFFFSLFFIFRSFWDIIFRFDFQTLHYRIFFTMNYKWLLIGGALGTFALWQKNKATTILLVAFVCAIFFMAIFKINSGYVRYSLTAFPILYILFSAGVFFLFSNISPSDKKTFRTVVFQGLNILVLLYIVISPLKKQKILLAPQYYYSINADVRENPIVDYKTAFKKIETLIGKNKNVILLDAWNDRVPFYMPKQNYIFLNRTGKGERDPQFNAQTYSTVEHFENIKKKYSTGIVIVENWESQTSPELQDHIRKTLKPQFTQETVKYNEKDSWSISIYSWGL